MTAATQWLERSLDDSANKRIAVPEAFLAADSILLLLENVARGLVVRPEVCRRRLEAELPFLATEEILMEGVRRGGNRQELHERLRVHARASSEKRAKDGAPADLLDRVAADSVFGMAREDVAAAARAEKLIGRAAEQVEVFIREELDPALAGVADAKPAAIRFDRGGFASRRSSAGASRPPASSHTASGAPAPPSSSPAAGGSLLGEEESRPGTAETTASRGSRRPRRIYNSSLLTAAHRELPLGTIVDVANVENGKTVRVRINDRGPFIKGRIIDPLARGGGGSTVGPGVGRSRDDRQAGNRGDGNRRLRVVVGADRFLRRRPQRQPACGPRAPPRSSRSSPSWTDAREGRAYSSRGSRVLASLEGRDSRESSFPRSRRTTGREGYRASSAAISGRGTRHAAGPPAQLLRRRRTDAPLRRRPGQFTESRSSWKPDWRSSAGARQKYGDVTAVDGLDLAILPGSALACSGPTARGRRPRSRSSKV
jgi:hypothetical protein